MASLYHSADCYVSPYLAEGFNLPALEAAACGLPIICTAGGPTDDFTTDAFAWRIRSRQTPLVEAGTQMTALLPEAQHLEQLMHEVVVDDAFRKQALMAGPAHVAAHFTWKHVVDKLLTVLLADAWSNK
jgi:glycosyltransferase involved in cell wall biosynthesis